MVYLRNYFNCSTHHAEGLVDPKMLAKKTVTDFGYPRAWHGDSENIKF
jgi:hypothetical protein